MVKNVFTTRLAYASYSLKPRLSSHLVTSVYKYNLQPLGASIFLRLYGGGLASGPQKGVCRMSRDFYAYLLGCCLFGLLLLVSI